MGKRGPAKKPTRQKILEGNPGHQKLNKNEPNPPAVDLVAPPSFLSERAAEKFETLGRELKKLGLLTVLDLDLLAAYCITWDNLLDANEQTRKKGSTFETESGYEAVSPFVAIRNKSIDHLKTIGREFGFSPAARSDLEVITDEAKEAVLEEFLYGKTSTD